MRHIQAIAKPGRSGALYLFTCLARGLNYDDAEDLAQKACWRAQSALNNFRLASSLATYLISVFANCLRDYMRKQRRRKTHEGFSLDEPLKSDDETQELVGDRMPSGETEINDLANAQIMQLIHAEVERILRSDHFEIFRLYYIELTYIDPRTRKLRKWTAEAIAERLDKPIDTVSSILKRMPEKLRNNPRIMQLAMDYRPPDAHREEEEKEE
ncbi:MAG: sigma-70 family RNA polymerase sigma factor [Anaerolineales bacterium]|nr:sigma-70 family RNA polymerase sigma factor [Anaerolineales bacterium]